MKPTNSWETTSFPMAYFHERSWKMERIFTRKRREKQLDAEQSLECLGVVKQVHLTTVASKKKTFPSTSLVNQHSILAQTSSVDEEGLHLSGKVYLQSTRKNDDTYIRILICIITFCLKKSILPSALPTYFISSKCKDTILLQSTMHII